MGHPTEAKEELEKAGAFFSGAKDLSGQIYTQLELAATEMETGRIAGAAPGWFRRRCNGIEINA